MMVHMKDKVYVYHFGIGGAGNSIQSSTLDTSRESSTANANSQSPSKARHPAAAERRYSTGIGGSGNISFANKAAKGGPTEDDEMESLLCDRSAHGVVLVEGRHHTGIGGFANKYRPTDLEDQEARLNNEHMRRQSLVGVARRRESTASTLVPSSGEGSRRGSIASVRDFVMGKGRRSSKA